MIFDSLKNARLYFNIGERFKCALRFLEGLDAHNLKPGRVEIADGVYANVQRYETKPREQCRYESHVKYADIQYAALGKEALGFASLGEGLLEADGVFDEGKNVVFYKGEGIWLPLRTGYFAILFPDDAHAPKANLDSVCEVVKIVVKVLL
jgi:YhcH/YjgK/YiaL family protein